MGSSALVKQTWIERLSDHKNNVRLVKHGTEILMGYLPFRDGAWPDPSLLLTCSK